MFITNNVNFDNTLSIKKFAKTQEAKNILNDNFHGNEKQFISFGDEEIVLTTYQKNGWIRKNYYSAENGEPEGEAFEGKWE